MSSGSVRVRFAPSPTGYLHVGGARTALYNYLFAKKNKGTLVLRVEDTDQARSTEESLRMQINDLQWLGLKWDEGPNPETLENEGSYGPYRQSQRLDIYKKYVDQLIGDSKAYYCFCKDEDLEAKRKAAIKDGRSPHYDGTCRNVTGSEASSRLESGEKGVVRFKVNSEKPYTLNDLVRGEVTFPAGMVGDFILLRSDGMPVFNFCCAVDDGLMKITHVFRAEEHLNNTVRQLMIYEALNFETPQFGHLSFILGADKQKLSKRHGATSCHEYKERGILASGLK